MKITMRNYLEKITETAHLHEVLTRLIDTLNQPRSRRGRENMLRTNLNIGKVDKHKSEKITNQINMGCRHEVK